MNKRVFLLLIVLTTIVSTTIHAQAPRIKKLEIDQRKSGLEVYSVTQDNQGYLWLGSNKGILRYNGLQYDKILLPSTVADSKVTCIRTFSNELIAGFENGMAIALKLDVTNANPRIFRIGDSPISDCLRDEKGRFWFSSEADGITVVTSSAQLKFTTNNGLPDNSIHAMIESSHRIYLGSDIGLLETDITENNELLARIYNVDNGLTDNLITCLAPNRGSGILVGAENGTVCLFLPQSKEVSPFTYFNKNPVMEIKSIYRFENEIFVLSKNTGLYTIQWPETKNVQHLDVPIPSNTANISGSTFDTEGNLIFANGSNELFLANLSLIYIHDHDETSFADTRAIICDKNGIIWFSNAKGIFEHDLILGIDRLAKLIYPKSTKQADIISLCEGPDGAIWFGTFGDGLGRLDPLTGKVKFFKEKNGLVNNNVLSISARKNELWLATLGGISRLDLATGKFENFDSSDEFASNYVYTTFIDNNNDVWFGTDGKGPVKYQDGQFYFLREHFPQVGKSIVAIAQDTLNNMWFYSNDKKIQEFTGNEIISADIDLNGDNAEVLAMASDRTGHMILLTTYGVASIGTNGSNLRYFSNEEKINSNFLNVITRDRLGQMWIGTEDAMIRYKKYVSAKYKQPITRIQKVMVMLQPTDTLNHVFEPDENHFAFHIAGLWYSDPEEVQYEYKMEGFDLDWVRTKDQNIVFSKLPPGHYKFRVRSYIGNDREKSNEQVYEFTIKRPIQDRTWFVVLVIFAIIAGIVLIVKLRLTALRKKEAVQRELFQSQFETLRNQVNPHFLFNSFNTLITTIAKSKEEGIDYVEKLSDYFRIILQQRDKETISVREELDLVEYYFFLQKKRFGDNLQVDIDVSDLALNSIIPPMSIQILAENAIKHNIITKAKPLKIRIYSTDNEIVVENNLQEKTTKEVSTGVGLNNIVNRYQILFNRSIKAVKKETIFEIRLPIILP
ncbi:MAG: two-component regulator propeller domain-containing protein [Flavobacteriales bacterium]